MKIFLLTFLLYLSALNLYSQEKRKNHFPIWTFHQRNINIHGLSVGLGTVRTKPRYTNTNGVKIELIGAGILVPMVPSSPIAQNESEYIHISQVPVSEKINGLTLSLTGTVCDCITNGVSLGTIGQINFQVNGATASIFFNFAQHHNGIQMALFNEAYMMTGTQCGITKLAVKSKGLQLGFINNSKHHTGIQIGLWNVNEKRKMPILNWNFHD